MPLGGRECLQERADLRGERWRSNRGRQESQSSAAAILFFGERDGQFVLELGPTPDASIVNFRLRAIRIIQPQNESLRKSVAPPQAPGMIRIALELRGTRHVAFDQN